MYIHVYNCRICYIVIFLYVHRASLLPLALLELPCEEASIRASQDIASPMVSQFLVVTTSPLVKVARYLSSLPCHSNFPCFVGTNAWRMPASTEPGNPEYIMHIYIICKFRMQVI